MKQERVLFYYDIRKEARLFLLWAFLCQMLSVFGIIVFLHHPERKILLLPVCFFLVFGLIFVLMYLFGRNYRIRITKTEFVFTALFSTKKYRLRDLKKYECRKLRNRWHMFIIRFGNEEIKPVTRNKRELTRLLNHFLET
ncbi:MAG TPA: hypothetical protein GYA05_02435 [Acholeplasmataceae bacterium]|nr:hypothetical protein [Acholeplasmataceae bacterium]